MASRDRTSKCDLCCTRLEKFGVKIGGHVLLNDVDLHIHCGELTGLIGPNGAGKSTLLKAMTGELPFTGKLSFLDVKDLRTDNPLIGYVPQHLDLDKGSPASVLDFCAACISRFPVWVSHTQTDKERIEENLTRFQAEHLINRRISNLSGGELQRVLLACALDPIPDLLLLDEPVAGVDPRGLEIFYNMVSDLRRDYDLSILMVSHDHAMISQFADRIVLLDKTVLAVGSPYAVLHDPNFVKLFGASMTMDTYHNQSGDTTRHHPTVRFTND